MTPFEYERYVGEMDVERNIRQFIHGDADGGSSGRGPGDRYASFDYCSNHFQAFHERGDVAALASPQYLEMSCLHLGFYLASWGMLRGSSFLLQKSARVYASVVRTIADADPSVWQIDADRYTRDNVAVLLKCSEDIRAALGSWHRPSDTLVTKIMLGVFGSVPAFDTFVCRAAGSLLGVQSFCQRSLLALGRFYTDHREVIERHRVPTLAFDTGRDTERRYTRAKVLDMALFIEGQRLGRGAHV